MKALLTEGFLQNLMLIGDSYRISQVWSTSFTSSRVGYCFGVMDYHFILGSVHVECQVYSIPLFAIPAWRACCASPLPSLVHPSLLPEFLWGSTRASIVAEGPALRGAIRLRKLIDLVVHPVSVYLSTSGFDLLKISPWLRQTVGGYLEIWRRVERGRSQVRPRLLTRRFQWRSGEVVVSWLPGSTRQPVWLRPWAYLA